MRKQKYNCPAELTIKLIGGRWRAVLLYNLRKNSRRFGELSRLSPGISRATLTKELRCLEESGLIQRVQIGRDRISGVEYSLTTKGESIKPILYSLIRWGLDHQRDHVVGEFTMVAFSPGRVANPR